MSQFFHESFVILKKFNGINQINDAFWTIYVPTEKLANMLKGQQLIFQYLLIYLKSVVLLIYSSQARNQQEE